jgi:hypothetical protein
MHMLRFWSVHRCRSDPVRFGRSARDSDKAGSTSGTPGLLKPLAFDPFELRARQQARAPARMRLGCGMKHVRDVLRTDQRTDRTLGIQSPAGAAFRAVDADFIHRVVLGAKRSAIEAGL